MRKNYNYERKKLLLPEYGRHIQEMVDFLNTIPQREERNIQARAVIAVMGNLNPMLRDTAEYTHKLWDHLFIMSDFKLDVDSPYPLPTAATLVPKPARLPYPRRRINRKQYGANIPKMIRLIEQQGDSPEAREAINDIARYMRAKSFEYNQDHPNNEVIIKEIKAMSENGIQIDEDAISNLKNNYKQTPQPKPNKTNRPNNKQKNNKRRGQR